MTEMVYTTGVDGSMTVRRHVEAISRFSFGWLWSVGLGKRYRRLNRVLPERKR